jgi:hypothetical protein
MNYTLCRWLFLLLLMPLSLHAAQAEEASQGFVLDPPRLMAVTVPGLQRSPDHFDVPVKMGAGNTEPFARSGRWAFFGGTVLTQKPQNIGPLLIELYGKAETGRKLMARVVLKYFPLTGNRWQPMYQLNQEPIMIKQGNQWVPLFDSQDSPEMLAILNKTLPNGEGYYPFLDVQFYKGPVILDSWIVKSGS